MPQLELFMFGDQFVVVLSLYIGLFFGLMLVEYFLVLKIYVYNYFNDTLSIDNVFYHVDGL